MDYNPELDNSTDPFSKGWNLPEGHLTLEDEVLLTEYARGLCVNLGTYKGRSAIIMSYSAEKVITIDNYVSPEFGHIEVKNWLFPFNNIYPIHSSTKEYDKQIFISDDTIDLLFIDAGHSKQDIIDDYLLFDKKLKRDGIVIIHDYKYMDGKNNVSMDVRGGVNHLLDIGRLQKIEITGWSFVGKRVDNGI